MSDWASFSRKTKDDTQPAVTYLNRGSGDKPDAIPRFPSGIDTSFSPEENKGGRDSVPLPDNDSKVRPGRKGGSVISSSENSEKVS